MKPLLRVVVVALSALTAALCLAAFSADASADIILHPGETFCVFEPGDIAGVDVFFAADDCMIIITSTGDELIVARAHLPAGFTLSSTFVGLAPCFGIPAAAHVTATVSGQVYAWCRI